MAVNGIFLYSKFQTKNMASTIYINIVMMGWPLFTAPAGGLFVWASPGDSGPDPLRLAEWARAADILLAPGCLFRPDRTDTPWLRFNVAFSHGEALRRFLLGYRRG